MKRSRMIGIIVAMMVLVLAVGIVPAVLFATQSSATSTQSKIDAKLEDLGAFDAQDQGIVADPFDETLEYRLYTSQANNLQYYFNPDTGDYCKSNALVSPMRDQEDATVEIQSEPAPALSREELRSIALEYAKNCVQDDLFGELRLDSETSTFYYFYEYYNDQRTGTRVTVTVHEDGEVTGSVCKITTLYQRNEDGTYSLKNGTDFISEEEAYAAADRAMMEALDGVISSADPDGAVCDMDNDHNNIFYIVQIPFQDTCETPCTRYCTIHVDAYTGEILALDYTK